MSQTVRVSLRQERDFRFAIRFAEDKAPFYGDEPPPLGASTGPSPSQLLAAAVGSCLSDSLLFALRKFKQSPEPIQSEAVAVVERNEQNRLRVQRIQVRIRLGVPRASVEHLERALAQFEDFCTVSQSVRQGIPVEVEVYDSVGERLK